MIRRVLLAAGDAIFSLVLGIALIIHGVLEKLERKS